MLNKLEKEKAKVTVIRVKVFSHHFLYSLQVELRGVLKSVILQQIQFTFPCSSEKISIVLGLNTSNISD